jgi:ArsR family transcriptional regulator
MPKNEALQQYKAKIFESLAHPKRIAILELLVAGNPLEVDTLARRLKMDRDEVMKHLSVLEERFIVMRHGNSGRVSFSLANQAIADALVMLRWYFEQHLTDALAMLDNISRGEETEESLHLREILAQLKEGKLQDESQGNRDDGPQENGPEIGRK